MHEAKEARLSRRGGVLIVCWTSPSGQEHTEPFPTFRRMMSFVGTKIEFVDPNTEASGGDKEEGSQEEGDTEARRAQGGGPSRGADPT